MTIIYGSKLRSGVLAFVVFAGSMLISPVDIAAQKLAIRPFQTGDGLAHNNVKQIFQDAKGYIWVATWEGLSRFDGYEFTSYGLEDGLGHIFINDLTADRSGRLWAATNGGGVSMLVDEPPATSADKRKKFVTFHITEGGENNPANFVNRFVFDRENILWCVTDAGLYRSIGPDIVSFGFEQVFSGRQPTHSNVALLDSRGRLWFSVSGEPNVVLQIANGITSRYEVRTDGSGPPTEIHTIVEDSGGRILASDLATIFELIEEQNTPGTWRRLPIDQPGDHILTMIPIAGSGLWIGTSGLLKISDERRTLYTVANGLSVNNVQAILPDREGNLWIGMSGGGVNKLSGEAVVSYSSEQGLPNTGANRIIEDRSGRLYAQMGCVVAEVMDDSKFVTSGGDKLTHHNCPFTQMVLQDIRGNWWYSTARGLEFSSRRMSGGTIVRDEKGDPIKHAQIYEDGEGTVWLTTDTGKLYRIGEGNNAEVVAENVPAEFIVRDRRSGTIWLANRGRLWRVRNGEVSEIGRIEGVPIIQPRSLFQDSKGRVWVGTRYHGALVTDEPEASEPRFRRYSTADGLGSDTVWEVGEDDDGRIYLGTGRGLDQLDITTGHIHHFTPDEGAISTSVLHLLKDSRGRIWAATDNGIMRIDPRGLSKAQDPPPIFLSQVRIAGEELPLPETGAVDTAPLDLAASRNNITIRYVGISFRGENALRYEYKLDGVDTDWLPAGNQREVNYANLASGSYRFSVRAINSENFASEQPAIISFRISPPIYLRWWFIVGAAIVIGLLIYVLYRSRLRQLIEIERTRTRIATDLHDDIGSDLSKISLLSDLARMRGTEYRGERDRMLSTIADISRSSVDAMRDIVWAIDPKRDSLLEMSRRMRTHAEEVFVDRNVLVEFTAPSDDGDLKLAMDTRRELFLIFKEAINNAAKHSGCSKVMIDLAVRDGAVHLRIADNGKGFDGSTEAEGNGLRNMRSRAEKTGGTFKVCAEKGTKIDVTVPR